MTESFVWLTVVFCIKYPQLNDFCKKWSLCRHCSVQVLVASRKPNFSLLCSVRACNMDFEWELVSPVSALQAACCLQYTTCSLADYIHEYTTAIILYPSCSMVWPLWWEGTSRAWVDLCWDSGTQFLTISEKRHRSRENYWSDHVNFQSSSSPPNPFPLSM